MSFILKGTISSKRFYKIYKNKKQVRLNLIKEDEINDMLLYFCTFLFSLGELWKHLSRLQHSHSGMHTTKEIF